MTSFRSVDSGPLGTGVNEEKKALFQRLLLEHGDKIYAFSFALARNEADASDLTAEAFRRALKSFSRYDVSRPFESWLFRIVQNIYRDGWRRAKTRKTYSLDEAFSGEDSELRKEPKSSEHAPDGTMEQEERRMVLERAVLQVPGVFREPLLLFDMTQMSYEKIADMLGIPVNTVRTRIFRGRKILREKLTPYFEAGGV